jgi:hypothetical protein
VQYREDDDDLVQHSEINSERERCSSARRTSPDTAGNWSGRSPMRANVRLTSPRNRSGEIGSFVLVPPRGILEIGLGEWPNDEPAGHSVQWLLSNFFRRRS